MYLIRKRESVQLITEYVDGEKLDQFVKKSQISTNINLIKQLSFQLLDVIKYLHS